MQRYLQINGSAVRLSMGREGLVRKYQRVCDQFQQVRGREATARELSSVLGLTLDEVEQLQLDARRSNTIPLETPTNGTAWPDRNGWRSGSLSRGSGNRSPGTYGSRNGLLQYYGSVLKIFRKIRRRCSGGGTGWNSS